MTKSGIQLYDSIYETYLTTITNIDWLGLAYLMTSVTLS